jgi:transcriptional regulator
MLEQHLFAVTDVAELREIVAGYGWATLTTAPPGRGLVVSHLPVVLDPGREGVAVLGHLAREDAGLHELGQHDVVLVVQGPHGYLSPSFYAGGPYVPTWNFVVVHLHGRPEPLTGDESYDVLERTVDHFERRRPAPWRLDQVADYAQRIAGGVVGFRLVPGRVVGKAKLSQDKSIDDVRGVVAALEHDAVHANPDLAAAMRTCLASRPANSKG